MVSEFPGDEFVGNIGRGRHDHDEAKRWRTVERVGRKTERRDNKCDVTAESGN